MKPRSAWDDALRWLRARDRSAAQVRAYLLGRGHSDDEVESTLQRLHQRRYLDDERFALALGERLAGRGHGSERARRDLAAAAVEVALVERVVEHFFGDQLALARHALGTRFRESLSDRDRARAARFLHSRGFPEDVVLAILGEGC